MGGSAAILVDYRVGLDYCQDLTKNHEIATQVLKYCYKDGVEIDMRKDCWQLLTSSISNLLGMYEYLRDNATQLLKQSNTDPLDVYLESVITQENLERYITNDMRLLPSIEDLRKDVNKMGLQSFRAFADDQIETAQQGQSQLDLMINQRYHRGGHTPWLYESSIKNQFNNDINTDILLDSYSWANKKGNSFSVLVTRSNSRIHTSKKKVSNSMIEPKFKIASPEEIRKEIE